MALFADRHAADEVTRRGRELLGQVVAALRARGMVLLEADTDGVFFAAPLGWSEAQERALVAEVAAELPAGIRLEYEGRFRAMLSHEVKNYALLTYDDQLIVRGVAMRSSRSEPFGERFLRQALAATLVGDIAGLQQAFRATVAAVAKRQLPAADLATRVRLSKTPAAYLAKRGNQREAAYEALLAAGRSHWSPGERVRCFRAQDGSYVWLPDETDGPPGEVPHRPDQDDRRDYDVGHYLQTLVGSYAGRLKKAFTPEDFQQLFRTDLQAGMFDRPLAEIEPLWVRCGARAGDGSSRDVTDGHGSESGLLVGGQHPDLGRRTGLPSWRRPRWPSRPQPAGAPLNPTTAPSTTNRAPALGRPPRRGRSRTSGRRW